ncbi:MAG TPA: TetR/AcrR family transcriptional regulator [Desulfobacterales bacterium]|nr:TetR/AcrR family transcriptional regulator [Desulfobacterales bacterium]
MGLKERREREREERKRQILAAARSLLFSEGLQATSINKIAKSAELGVGTIYFYFANKEEIFAALQEEGIELLYNKIKKSLVRVNYPEERLKTIARVYLNFSRENKDYFDIINYFLSSPAVGLIDGLLQLEHILVVTTRKNA